jgi:hypothetical protein
MCPSPWRYPRLQEMFRFASILYPVEVAFERYFGIACPDLSYLIAIIGLK